MSLPERTFAEGEPARRTMDKAGVPEGTVCTQVAASCKILPGRQDLQYRVFGEENVSKFETAHVKQENATIERDNRARQSNGQSVGVAVRSLICSNAA